MLNAGQKYCRMLQVEHSAILSTFSKLPFVIKMFVLSIFEWPLNAGFTVLQILPPYTGRSFKLHGINLENCVWIVNQENPTLCFN